MLIHDNTPDQGGHDSVAGLTPREAAALRQRIALKAADDSDRGINSMDDMSREITVSSADTANNTQEILNFSEERYRRIETVRSTMRKLTIDDLPQILNLYEELEMSEKAFEALNAGGKDIENLFSEVKEGRFIDRCRPNADERAAAERYNPHYISSGEEMRMFLEGTHERCQFSDFHVWGHFDEHGKLISFYSVFLPSRDLVKKQKHGKFVRDFFCEEEIDAKHYRPFTSDCLASEAVRNNAEVTAEFHMVGISRKDKLTDEQSHDKYKGLAALGFFDMLKQLEIQDAVQEGRLERWFLVRFGALKELEPDPKSEEEGGDFDNEGSRKLFKYKLGFNTIGRHTDKNQVAVRIVNATPIVVSPSWNVMQATADTVLGYATEQNRKQIERGKSLAAFQDQTRLTKDASVNSISSKPL